MLSDETRISNTLSSLETDFLSAVQHGPDALFTYQKSWSNFNTEVTNCVNQLHEDTKLKIFNFTARMSTMASMFLNVTTAADNLGRQLEEDITSIVREDFAKLTIQDKPYPTTDNSVAPYIPLTYKWLLDNLHNPYPTKDIRLSISSSTNSPVKDIDAWFIDARKRIGWNQLRKDHFTTRGDLIKAATEFFMPPQSVLSPPRKFIRLDSIKRDFSSQFAHIEARAQSLYSDRLFPSNLASNLENMITNPSEAISETQEQRQGSRLENLTSYPTPEYSPASTSSPLPDSSSNASFGSSRKRSRSYSEPLSDDEPPVPRNAKLKRHVSSEELEHAAATSLPSPAMSLREIGSNGSPSSVVLTTLWKSTEHSAGKRKHPSTDVDGRSWKRANTEMLAHANHVDELLSTSLSPAVIKTSAKRKRSLTNDHERPQKRPSNSDSAQNQTISDPPLFSAQSTLDDWFKDIPLSEYQITLDIPAPVTEENFDEFSEFDVDYYNYDFSSYPNQTTDITLSAIEPSINSLELQDANFPKHSRDMPSNHLWDSASSVININQPASNLPSFSWDFDGLSTSSGSSGSWESALLTDLLSPDWTNDPSSISRILSQSTWQSGDIANHLASSTETSITSPFGSTAFPLSAPHMSDAKTTKLHQYHKLLAEAQLLRAELAI